MTRSEYISHAGDADSAAQHRKYYAQFVTPEVKALVQRSIGVTALCASKDPHLNDILLGRWDALVTRLPHIVVAKLKECGDYLTLGNGVCILKEAARQLIEEKAP
jgi:hypothetical protein